MTETTAPSTPQPEPLFSLDLMDNGGLFAPSTIDEIGNWIKTELSFWSWINNVSTEGNHDEGIKSALALLINVREHVTQALQHKDSNPQHYQSLIAQIQNGVKNTFIQVKLPHSSTTLAKRINAYRQENDVRSGKFYASVFIPPSQSHTFHPKELLAWRGLIEGLIDRFDLANAPQKRHRQAGVQSFEQLKTKAEKLFNEKSGVLDALHRDYSGITKQIHNAASEQTTHFETDQNNRNSEFADLVKTHKEEMENLRKTFREEIALRAPASYWTRKRKAHLWMASITGVISFVSMGCATYFIGVFIHDLLGKTAAGTVPESWRIATLILIGLFSVWGVRLLVRMFLSNLHLITDADERVVMVQTYLSLLEGDQLSNKDDRQLILQALFRPASDGIVKDEGLPPSMFEFLTPLSNV